MDNKLFWKTIKSSFSDKIVTRNRIHLTKNDEVVKTELETAETLNNIFGNVIKNLMIPKYSEYDPSIDRVENRTIRAILKYRNHPSILAIRERKKAQINFCFKEMVRNGNCLARANIHSIHLEFMSIAKIASKKCNKLPNDIKEASSLTIFENKIWDRK